MRHSSDVGALVGLLCWAAQTRVIRNCKFVPDSSAAYYYMLGRNYHEASEALASSLFLTNESLNQKYYNQGMLCPCLLCSNFLVMLFFLISKSILVQVYKSIIIQYSGYSYTILSCYMLSKMSLSYMRSSIVIMSRMTTAMPGARG